MRVMSSGTVSLIITIATLAVGLGKGVSSIKKKLDGKDTRDTSSQLEDVSEYDDDRAEPEHRRELRLKSPEREKAVIFDKEEIAVNQRILPEKQEPSPKEKIDRKKLIIYSEIMKPKYDEGLK